ncbi:MAG: DNA-binding response regulator [Micavibrio sp. TMED27]|nr:DNA-binding response regulator [Micavibrio sp.]OUT91318.1 MAG: DNA-binding response regulator [Micavibrio sp. TMED27]|tara:strand:+ start:70 stop:747 length:678 start_codon:yes stop_codon:yes gene_type:complete
MRLLLIEDDPEVSAFISKGMKEAGYTIDTAFDGKNGLFLATTEDYDLMIVDRMLPELDGLTIIKTIRGTGKTTPVLILSALGEVDDRVKGLRSGGDDYLVKPFAFAELLARVEVLFRRQDHVQGVQETRLKAGDLELDLLSRKVIRGDREIELQAREFKLLEYMLRNKGRLVTRTMLLEHVWDYHFDPQTNVIDVHVSRLRGKIEKGFDSKIVRTVRGAGYIIDE